VEINGTKVVLGHNNDPVEYKDIFVYSSDTSHNPAAAFIRNLQIESNQNL